MFVVVSLMNVFVKSELVVSLNCLIRLLGNAVAQLVEALRYEPEGRGFNYLWCHWDLLFT
jgi:hypothetical protein